jgi:hypothetical protein
LFRLHTILETIRSSQVEDLILVGDLVESAEVRSKAVSSVDSVFVSD